MLVHRVLDMWLRFDHELTSPLRERVDVVDLMNCSTCNNDSGTERDPG